MLPLLYDIWKRTTAHLNPEWALQTHKEATWTVPYQFTAKGPSRATASYNFYIRWLKSPCGGGQKIKFISSPSTLVPLPSCKKVKIKCYPPPPPRRDTNATACLSARQASNRPKTPFASTQDCSKKSKSGPRGDFCMGILTSHSIWLLVFKIQVKSMNLMKARGHNGLALHFDPHKGEAVQVTRL